MDSSKLNINKGFESMLPKASIPNKEEESVRILSQLSLEWAPSSDARRLGTLLDNGQLAVETCRTEWL